MRMTCMKRACVAVTAFALSQAFAADGVWTNTAGGNWNDAENWRDGIVAGGEGAIAYITNTPTAYSTVVLPAEGVTLGKLVYDRRGTRYQMRFRGGPFLFVTNAPEIASESIYTIFYNDLQSATGLVWRGGVVGTDTSYTGPTVLQSSWIYDYMHLGALSQVSSISNYLSTGPLIFGGGSLTVSGRANSSATASAWYLTAGDTLVRKVASSLSASPGAAVTGTGIPDGTFVKYNIDGDTFELSQAATATGTNTLSFAAVSGSQSFQTFEKIQMDTSGTLEVLNNGGMLTRVEAGDLTGGAVTLTKAGDGTLAVSGGNAFGGVLNLTGGTFESNAKDGVQPALSNVILFAKTAFSVPCLTTTATLYNVSGTGELVKVGSGGIVLKYTAGTNTQVTVSEGTLTLTPPVVPTNAPVEGSWFHVDASDPASLTTVAENGTNFVAQWNDLRTNGVCAASVAGKPRPFLRNGFQNGRPVVDFGSLNYTDLSIAGYGAYLNWNTPCTALREAFLVYSDTPEVSLFSSFLLGDTSTFHFHRGDNRALFSSSFASANLRNGTMSIDETNVLFSAVLQPGFHVISLSSAGAVSASTFGRDRSYRCGGQRLAEVLIYTNALTEVQRRDTKAYLFRKWLGRDYPGYQSATQAAVGTLKLSGDGVFTVNAGEDLRVGVLEVGGNIVKKGAGTLTAEVFRQTGGSLTVAEGMVALSTSDASAASRLTGIAFTNDASLAIGGSAGSLSLGWLDAAGALAKSGAGSLCVGTLGDGVDRLDVEGGDLTVSGADDVGAWFHVDAADSASQTLVTENGTNFVTRWSDTRTNGVYAASVAGKPRPFLRNGFQNGRPVVDFGSLNYTDLSISGYGAYLNWSSTCSTIREVFLVYSDTPEVTGFASFLLGAGSTYHFHRGYNRAVLDSANASANLLNGRITFDGTNVSSSAVLSSGFQVISLAPTGSVTASNFGLDRSLRCGGQRLGEVLVYTNVLKETVRQGMRSYLLGKWKNIARSFDSIRAVSGSALTLEDGVLSVGSLQGGGSVSAAKLSASALSAGDAVGDIGTLSVAGALELADGAVVTVDCAPPAGDCVAVDGTLKILGGGTFAVNCTTSGFGAQSVAVFTFSSIEGAGNLSAWAVTGNILTRYSVRPEVDGNRVVLVFKAKGTLLSVR